MSAMKEKFLTDYIDEIFELIDGLPEPDQAALVEAVRNIFIRENPETYINWAQPLAERENHPHNETLSCGVRDAYKAIRERAREQKTDK